jgi:hypothetical protein
MAAGSAASSDLDEVGLTLEPPSVFCGRKHACRYFRSRSSQLAHRLTYRVLAKIKLFSERAIVGVLAPPAFPSLKSAATLPDVLVSEGDFCPATRLRDALKSSIANYPSLLAPRRKQVVVVTEEHE